MEFDEIKELLEQEGGKIIIVEHGKPVMVVLSYQDFKNRSKGNAVSKVQEHEDIEDIPLNSEENITEELTIDDLPL